MVTATKPGEVAEPDAQTTVTSKLCSVCEQNAFKYRCPGCQAQTCSLSCSKQHKQQTGCTGQRDKFAFVPMQQFSDRQLLRDYRWLEEVSRADNNARRLRPPTPRKELPHHLGQLVHQARYRGVKLLIMPPGMQKRQHNSTRYDFRNRRMFWRVDWRFPAAAAAAAAAASQNQQHPATTPIAITATGSEQQEQQQQQQQQQQASTTATTQTPDCIGRTAKPYVITDGRVDEELIVSSVLQRHLEYQPGAGGQALMLRAFREAGVEKLTVIMRKERCPANAVCYHRIELQQSLRSQLAGKLVIEYPSFIVLLPGEESSYRILTPEEEQQQRQRQYVRPVGAASQQRYQLLPPHPPPPRTAAVAQQDQQQQQQQQDADQVHPEQPGAKRQCVADCNVAKDAVAVGAADSNQAAEAEVQLQDIAAQQRQQQQQSEARQQDDDDDNDQSMPKYYYYDPTAGADEDAADFLAGLEDDDDDADVGEQQKHGQQQQQQGLQVQQQQSVVLGGEEGRAAMMALLGQYDENEIDID